MRMGGEGPEAGHDSAGGGSPISRAHCYLLLSAAATTSVLITLGGIVCVTGSGLGCPDWPGCYGAVVPPMDTGAIIEYTHRVAAALASPLILAAAILGWRKARPLRWVSRPPAIALILVLAVIVFGAFAVLTGLPPAIAALDVASALMVLALMLTASVVAFSRRDDPALPDRLSLHGGLARLTALAAMAVFLVLVSGVLVADTGSIVRCLGWPLYTGGPAAEFHNWRHASRSVMAGAASLLAVAVVVQAWRTHRSHSAIRRTATALGFVLLAQTSVGLLMLTRGPRMSLLVASVTAAVALWAVLVALVVLAGLTSATGSDAAFVKSE